MDTEMNESRTEGQDMTKVLGQAWLSAEQLADITPWTVASIRHRVRRGQIPSAVVGGSRVIPASWVQEVLDSAGLETRRERPADIPSGTTDRAGDS